MLESFVEQHQHFRNFPDFACFGLDFLHDKVYIWFHKQPNEEAINEINSISEVNVEIAVIPVWKHKVVRKCDVK